MTSGVSIRRASFADCDHLAMVGAAAYVAAYAHIWASAAPLSHFLRTFAPDRFEALVEDPAAYLWLAQSEGEIVGFLSMLVGSHDPIIGEPGGAEIPRLYLLPGARGQGLGRRLMKAAESNARQLGLAYL